MKIAGIVVFAAAAAFGVYYFVWPMFAGGGDDGAVPTATASATTTPPQASTGPDGPATPAAAGQPATDPRAAGPRPAQAQPTPTPTGPTPSPPAATTTVRRGPSPPPSTPSSPAGGSGGNGRQLLAGGDIPAAANAFLSELRSSGRNKFTVAVGLYCNADNVGRLVQNASGAEQLYVLPTTVQGKQCFRIVWGTFDTRQAAEQGKGSVPSSIRAGDTAAVPVASVLR